MLRKTVIALSVLFFLFALFPDHYAHAAASSKPLLKKGMRGTYVKNLQTDLKTLGFFYVSPTGYFGSITKTSVIKFQKKYKLQVDGIVGPQTHSTIDKLLGRTRSTTIASRSSSLNRNLLVPWFDNAENILYRGATAKIIDVDTGLSFSIKRTYGYNHADCETLTASDTAIMKKIYGGQWSWSRRAIIVVVNGRRLAASMAGMPHAGREDLKSDIWVDGWRTGGYGDGYNFDRVKGNNMSGHFDVHFLNSKTHGTNRVDEGHQAMVQKASKSGY